MTKIPVDVYYNLHRSCWSVRDRKTGKVIGHVPFIRVDNPTFVVQPAGNRKVRKEKRKNVHAFVRGTVSWPISGNSRPRGTRIPVTYNPYKHTTFVTKEGNKKITEAKVAILTTTRELIAVV